MSMIYIIYIQQAEGVLGELTKHIQLFLFVTKNRVYLFITVRINALISDTLRASNTKIGMMIPIYQFR